jgi:hypothetical protein
LGFVLIKRANRQVDDIAERDKCPVCFGVSVCQAIDEHKVTLLYTDFYSIFNNLLGIKNVYYGKYVDENVIIKKLAKTSELQSFDNYICEDDKLNELCFKTKSNVQNKSTGFYDLIIAELKNHDLNDPNIKMKLCPVSHISNLISNLLTMDNLKNEDYFTYLWSTININPEPLMLQVI